MESKQTDINYQALASNVAKADIEAFKSRETAKKRSLDPGSLAGGIIVFGIFVATTVLSISIFQSEGKLSAKSVVVAFMLVVSTVSIALVVRYVTNFRYKNFVRLERFASDNGFEFRYDQDVVSDEYDGMIFNQGHSRKINEVLIMPDGSEIGGYQYVTGSGKNRSVHNYSYVRIALSRALPHMVLDAKSNNFLGTFSNLPYSYQKNQTLSLEGDFDTYFTLYAPKEYERDALYVFTPDVMASLIDSGSSYDMEVVGSSMYLYQTGTADLSYRKFIEQKLKLMNAVAPKLRSQTKRYADERVGDRTVNKIAPEGARLKPGVNWLVVVSIVLVATYYTIDAFDIRLGGFNIVAAVPYIVIGLVYYLFRRKKKDTHNS